MRIFEIVHPKWGSNLAKSVNASGLPESAISDGFDNNDCLKRFYHHRCGLFGISQSQSKSDRILFALFLEGHVVSTIWPEQLEIRVDPSITALNGGNMIADIWFSGEGPLNGPLESYFINRAIIYIANPEQLSILSTRVV